MVTGKKPGKRSDEGNSEGVGVDADNEIGNRIARTTAPRQLDDPVKRAQWNLPDLDSPDETGSYIIELNVQHASGLPGAARAFLDLYAKVIGEEVVDPRARRGRNATGRPAPLQIDRSYFRCDFKEQEWRRIVGLDEQRATAERAIYRIWPDFPISANTDRSVATIKGDAALRSFDAAGERITWAVVDSGVEASHPHFGMPGGEADLKDHALLSQDVVDLHRCFTSTHEDVKGSVLERGPLASPDWDPAMKAGERDKLIAEHRKWALSDHYGHGTHVAGIIAGAAPATGIGICALERQYTMDADGGKASQSFGERSLSSTYPRGVAPKCKIVSLRVLDRFGKGRASDVIQALEYIREKINDNGKFMRVHGVNLSVGYEFDPEMFAAGQSPLCVAVDRLVQVGVVVVVAAGNTGYGTVAVGIHTTSLGLSNSINDPGNAAQAITVGSTHRDSPHTYGVSYFSSKGPTGDGRLKPDLVAPGERITSCAAGDKLAQALATGKKKVKGKVAYYVDDSGTSMAAPHVSGAIAAFLSVRREFIGKPQEVKRIFLDSATPLGRERYFEGHGLVDLMRALQLV